jgi:hypothetical protein
MSARFRLRALLVLIAVGVSVFAFARPAAASSDEDFFVNQINAIRAARGLGALAVDGQLSAVAMSWSQHMAGDGNLAHNPSLGSQVSGWRTLGENVGTGPGDASIEAALENSPHHFENIVDPSFNSVGVGVVRDSSGTYWVTEDFKQSTNAPRPAPAPAAPKPAAPKPAPKPASAPRPAPAPVHAAPVHAVAAPTAPVTTPVATTVPAAAPATVPLAVLGSTATRSAAGPALGGVPNPFTAANLTGLVALVVLGASMALFARVRVTRALPPISG